jgi:hypothetical protein
MGPITAIQTQDTPYVTAKGITGIEFPDKLITCTKAGLEPREPAKAPARMAEF